MGALTNGTWNTTNGLPVRSGLFIDNVLLQVDGTNAFTEDSETATLSTGFPASSENPYTVAPPGGIGGDWSITAHATIANLRNSYRSAQSGTTTAQG